jgi:4-hydroxybenzoyl-CoA reductase subunit beta
MRLPRFEYVRPQTLEEALSMLAQSGTRAKILAGGTDMLVNMKQRTVCPELVVSIKTLPELSAVAADAKGGIAIGAAANLTDLTDNAAIAEKFPAFSQAVRAIASKHIRNMACIGGNVCLETRCWYYNQSNLWRAARECCHRTGGSVCHAIKGAARCHAINSSDTAPVLVALDATIEIMKKGGRRLIPARQFYRDDGISHTLLEPSEMVTALHLPGGSNGAGCSAFIKLSMRRGIDFALCSIAAQANINGTGAADVSLVLGSIASLPVVLEKAAQVIMESGLTESAIKKAGEVARTELGILTNLYTPAGYKRQLAEVLVKRALNELREKTAQKERAKA